MNKVHTYTFFNIKDYVRISARYLFNNVHNNYDTTLFLIILWYYNIYLLNYIYIIVIIYVLIVFIYKLIR